jgi:tight adherence protein B
VRPDSTRQPFSRCADMSVALGFLGGAGLLLTVAPWLWPTTGRPERAPSLLTARWRERLTQAGLAGVRPATVIVVSVLLGFAAAAITAAIVPVTSLAIGSAVAGFAIPALVVSARARAGRRSTRVVWPDVVDHLVSAVRSGLALPDSVVTLAHSGPPATRGAFSEFETFYRTTGNFPVALDRLKDRLVDPVADRIIETLRMSREVGGHELPTVLRALSQYLRQEAAVRDEVEARQSWTVNAARLGVAAPWIILVLLATRPEAAAAYNTAAGTAVVFVGAALSVVAYRLMLLLGRLPEERRWFQ